MPHPKDEYQCYDREREPRTPITLPPELADFLRTQELACLAHASDYGTLYVIKLPATELVNLYGTFPIGVEHELHRHAAAPVIRTILTFSDQPDQSLRLESFTNPADAQQRAEFAALADQEELVLLFYDEQLRHRLSKRLPTPAHHELQALLTEADRLLATIPPERLDFDRAKAAVLEATSL